MVGPNKSLKGNELTIFPPWFDALLGRYASLGERVPHALLIHGQRGIGKRLFGRRLARGLLCESIDATSQPRGGCGVCAACVWFDQGNHPDFRRITTEVLAAAEGQALADDEASDVEPESGTRSKRAPSKEIKVEQVRALQTFLNVATHRSRARVVLLYPLESVNAIAANALLKMLEEPPSRTVFILVADHLGRIPATIVSRCHRIPVPTPSRDEAVAWLREVGVVDVDEALALSGGAPLAACDAAADGEAIGAHRELIAFLSRPGAEAAMATAEAFGRQPAGPPIRWMQLWLADCLSSRLAGRVRYHPAQSAGIERLARAARLDALTVLMQRVEALRRNIDHPLNTRLMLEGLLTAYAEAMQPRSPPV